jgi:ABC-type Fe3+ transport system permease subunit
MTSLRIMFFFAFFLIVVLLLRWLCAIRSPAAPKRRKRVNAMETRRGLSIRGGGPLVLLVLVLVLLLVLLEVLFLVVLLLLVVEVLLQLVSGLLLSRPNRIFQPIFQPIFQSIATAVLAATIWERPTCKAIDSS